MTFWERRESRWGDVDLGCVIVAADDTHWDVIGIGDTSTPMMTPWLRIQNSRDRSIEHSIAPKPISEPCTILAPTETFLEACNQLLVDELNASWVMTEDASNGDRIFPPAEDMTEADLRRHLAVDHRVAVPILVRLDELVTMHDNVQTGPGRGASHTHRKSR